MLTLTGDLASLPKLEFLGGDCSNYFLISHGSIILFLPNQMDLEPLGKFLQMCIVSICAYPNINPVSNICSTSPFPFRKLETDVSAKLITVLLYLCLEFKELLSSGLSQIHIISTDEVGK